MVEDSGTNARLSPPLVINRVGPDARLRLHLDPGLTQAWPLLSSSPKRGQRSWAGS